MRRILHPRFVRFAYLSKLIEFLIEDEEGRIPFLRKELARLGGLTTAHGRRPEPTKQTDVDLSDAAQKCPRQLWHNSSPIDAPQQREQIIGAATGDAAARATAITASIWRMT
jgi:hypothetical protein